MRFLKDKLSSLGKVGLYLYLSLVVFFSAFPIFIILYHFNVSIWIITFVEFAFYFSLAKLPFVINILWLIGIPFCYNYLPVPFFVIYMIVCAYLVFEIIQGIRLFIKLMRN